MARREPEVPSARTVALNDRPVRRAGDHVLYWMTAARRARDNFALDRAVDLALELGRPLIVLEALRADYPWASERTSRFVIDGMRDNARDFAAARVTYFPYREPTPGAGRGLVAALAERACLVVTDDHPGLFLPRMSAAAAARAPVRFEAVDSNGLLPMRSTTEAFPTAYGFRRFLQRTLPAHLDALPRADAFEDAALPTLGELPEGVRERWQTAELGGASEPTSTTPRGGSARGRDLLDRFLRERLALYAEHKNEPDRDASSGLSPYLHFGHVSVHAIWRALVAHERWKYPDLGESRAGKRAGFWNMGGSAEAFLDELVTWRELCFNTALNLPAYDRFESLPAWARATLAAHATDRREHVYSLEELESAATHDPLWNAAQTELARDGRIHNYLRMLWGKKILEWSRTPEDALAHMVELNNRLALDGRDPNSYGGIFWVLGRYDRPWAPERSVFGTVRYMSSANTARKYDVADYVARNSPGRARNERLDFG